MNTNPPSYYTVSAFAQLKKVPEDAVLLAIRLHAIPALKVEGAMPLISYEDADVHPFELIDPYEFADRKGVAPKTVYNNCNNEKSSKIQYVLDENDKIKIDWTLFSSYTFRVITFNKNKRRGLRNN